MKQSAKQISKLERFMGREVPHNWKQLIEKDKKLQDITSVARLENTLYAKEEPQW